MTVPYRVVIAGGPSCGKTTMSHQLAASRQVPTVLHTDSLIGMMSWSEVSAEVARWFDAAGPWIIEGVACGRALRKWLTAAEFENPRRKPCEVVLYLNTPHVELTNPQTAMLKGCLSVWSEVEADLRKRGVVIITSIDQLEGGP